MLLDYILIEPNPIQRLHLSQLFKKIKILNFRGEFSNALEAQNFLNYQSVDLIFIAAKLPVYSGFDFIEKLNDPVEIVVLTENPKDALQAYEVGLSYCIAPPFTISRIEISAQRVKNKLQLKKQVENKLNPFIEIKHDLKNEKIILNSILWVEAMGDYVKIITKKKKYLVLSSMKKFMEKLPSEQFHRIHKSYIINLKRVNHYSASYVNIDGKELPVSRNKKKEFRQYILRDQ